MNHCNASSKKQDCEVYQIVMYNFFGSQAMMSCRSLLSTRHSRNLSESMYNYLRRSLSGSEVYNHPTGCPPERDA